MRFVPILPAFLTAVTYAAYNSSDTSTSIASTQICITKYRPANGSPASLPTRTKIAAHKITSVVTTCETKSTVTETITPGSVFAAASLDGNNVYGSTSGIELPKRANSCATTTTVSKGTTTIYTGSYNGTGATHAPSPRDFRYPPVHHQRHTFQANVFHFVGQRAINAGQKPVAVACLDQVTTYLISTSTIEEPPTTVTVTDSTPTLVTPSIKVADGTTPPVSITSTFTASSMISAETCTVTVASSTTTQHLKCAPTNLISEVNGYGIGQTGGSSANTRGLAPGSDASACCQLCVDDDECAASEDDTDAGNCFLWYTEPSCGVGFEYSDGGQKLAPGTGFLVQTGCGTIEATDSF